MRHLRRFFVVAGVLFGMGGTAAAQDARVSASVNADGTTWLGQQVTITLELSTNGTSFSDVHFNLPDVAGAFLLRVDSSTIKRTERIDGESWQVVGYPVALFPNTAGRIEVPPVEVRFSVVERFGAPPKAFSFATEPLALDVTRPPGAREGSLVVSTRSFELEHAWEGVGETLRAGDAVTLTVTRRAADISAMLLPPLPVFETEGLAAYPDAPEVTDRGNRGALTGERVDRITWIVEQAGDYRLPGIRFQWWDPVNERLREQVVPGAAFEALAAPAATGGSVAAAPDPRAFPWWLAALALLAGAAWLAARDPARSWFTATGSRLGATLRRARRRILPPRRALLARINPGPVS